MNRFLFKPIDIATLVLFRIVAGCLLAFEQINQLLSGDFNNYLEPQFHFSYMFFPWIKPLPPQGMYLLIGITIAAGFFVAAGLFYRASATVLFIGYSLLFLMEETEYVNHFYLYCLLCFILILVPAHRAFSMDVVRKPWLKRAYTPAWAVYILLFQISLVYFYAGVAKLHPDWLEARPLQIWMAAKASRAVIGPMLAHPFTPWLMSYAGVAVDLLFAPLLLFRRTRIIGLALAVIFHSSNALIFGLATFPWFSLLLTSMYFSPSWPRRLPVLRRHLPAFNPEAITFNQQKIAYSKVLSSFLILYAAVQILVPLRHFLYPGNVNWTEEGHKFAWHMMLRSKSGSVTYSVVLPEEENRLIIEHPHLYLTHDQTYKLPDQPDLILQFAHFLKEKYQQQGHTEVQVFADAYVSLNGRPAQPIVDKTVDLAAEARGLHAYSWILPLKE